MPREIALLYWLLLYWCAVHAVHVAENTYMRSSPHPFEQLFTERIYMHIYYILVFNITQRYISTYLQMCRHCIFANKILILLRYYNKQHNMLVWKAAAPYHRTALSILCPCAYMRGANKHQRIYWAYKYLFVRHVMATWYYVMKYVYTYTYIMVVKRWRTIYFIWSEM